MRPCRRRARRRAYWRSREGQGSQKGKHFDISVRSGELEALIAYERRDAQRSSQPLDTEAREGGLTTPVGLSTIAAKANVYQSQLNVRNPLSDHVPRFALTPANVF